MREDDRDWFTRWEEELPSPEELIPLSQSLISPDLALAFDIRLPGNTVQPHHHQSTPPPQHLPSSQANSSAEFAADSADLGSGATAAGDEPARTLKRPRLVWTPQLHKRFVDAVAHLGIKNAVPKTIMQLMSVDGLTRENVASHLQKYRLYLKRMQGLSSGGGGSDSATDRLFASSPVPAHFLHPNRVPSSDHYMPSFVPIATLQQQQQQMAAVAAAAAAAAHLQPPQFHHRQIAAAHYGSPTTTNGQFGSAMTNGKFDQSFLARQTQQQQQTLQRMSTPSLHSPVGNYVEDLESAKANGGRTALTLFPTRDD